MDIKQFEQIKKSIAQAKDNKSRAEGMLQGLMDRLKNEFSLSSVKEAEAKVQEYQKSIDRDTERLNDLFSQLEKAADWDSL